MKSSYFVYILLCENNSYYTGYTDNLERRYQKHCEGVASKYTRSFKPIKISASWELSNKSSAMKAEAYIKKLSRAKKESLIANPAKFDF